MRVQIAEVREYVRAFAGEPGIMAPARVHVAHVMEPAGARFAAEAA